MVSQMSSCAWCDVSYSSQRDIDMVTGYYGFVKKMMRKWNALGVQPHRYSNSALHLAIAAGDDAKVRELLGTGRWDPD